MLRAHSETFSQMRSVASCIGLKAGALGACARRCRRRFQRAAKRSG